MLKRYTWLKVYLIFILLFSIQFIVSLFINNWNFAYPLDDPYIHLAIAKNFASHGVWGPTQYEFASSSSSILYTLMLSAFFYIGLNTVYLSLIINLLAASLLFFSIKTIAQNEHWSDNTAYTLSLSIMIFAPTLALALTGMEHILHMTVTLFLFYYTSKIITGRNNSKQYITLGTLACLAISLRYETLFIMFSAALLLMIKRKYVAVFILIIGGLVPISIFGFISIHNGGYFFPNSIIAKGETPVMDMYALLQQSWLWLERLFRYPHILSCFIILIFGIFSVPRTDRNLQNKWVVYSILVIITFILHLTFAGVGWFFRYESYLIAASLLSLGNIINKYLSGDKYLAKLIFANRKVIIIILIIISPLTVRSLISFYKSSLAPKNIYEQQIQMANFIKDNDYKSVLINDIGAVSYYCDIRLLDLNGLATKEILNAWKNNQMDINFLDSISRNRNCEIAIIYDGILKSPYPSQWRKAGYWQISSNVVCWQDILNFYAIDSSNIESVMSKLEKYSAKLPPDVKISINR